MFLITTFIAVRTAFAAEILPIDKGVYVLHGGVPCQQAPLGAVLSYDGTALFGAHESKCRTSVIKKFGSTYMLETKCNGAGDGSPSVPTNNKLTVQVPNMNTFVVTSAGKTYRYERCVGF